MFKQFFVFFCLLAVALITHSIPIGDSSSVDDVFNMDLNFTDDIFRDGDLMFTKEQEEQMKNPNVGVINTAGRWPMNLNGHVIIPYVFNAQAGFREFNFQKQNFQVVKILF
jgi:hypothetical protein